MIIYPLLSYPTLSPKQPPMRGEQSRIACIWIAHSHVRRVGARSQRIKRSLSITLSLTFIYSHESFSIEPLNLASDIKAEYQDSMSLWKDQRHYLKLWPWCQDQLTHSSLAAIHQAWAQYFKTFFSIYSPSLTRLFLCTLLHLQRTSWQGYCLPTPGYAYNMEA